jgi:hypothetical protein
VKVLAVVAVPPGVTTVNRPDVAAAGTVDRIDVAELMVNAAETPLKRTAVALLKFVPLMTTAVPTGPLAGVKLEIVGGSVFWPTTTFCSIVPVRCRASVIVSRTNLVPGV